MALAAPALAATFPHAAVRGQRDWQLTRRGRVVLVLAATVFLLLAVVTGGHLTATATSDAGTAPASASIVVEPGESLWQIAKRVAPGQDPRAVALEIRELNGLTDSTLVAGTALTVPLS